MKLLWGRGGRLAVVVAVTGALLSGTTAEATGNIVLMSDRSGDAHAASPLCAVDCSGAPTPVSEPSVDVRTARVDRVGDDLVYQWKVVDLSHVPLAQPDDTVGYHVGFQAEGLAVDVTVHRTAAQGAGQAVVVVTDFTNRSTRPVSSSFDHATDTVRATVPLVILNDAVDDVCGSCHVDSGTAFEGPFGTTYVLGTTPLGPTGPIYQDMVRTKEPLRVVPTSDGSSFWYFGGGPFQGTITFHPPSPECGESPVATMSITANVAFSNGNTHYVGPVTLGGSGCGGNLGTVMGSNWSMHGTDIQGRTIDCPQLGGMAVSVVIWNGGFGGACTLDGIALPRANPVVFGEFVPTGISLDRSISSGAVAGVMTISAFADAS